MTTVLVNQFDGGVSDDPRSSDSPKCSMCKHFDIFSYPHKLVPYGGMQSDQTTETMVGNLLIGSDGIIYGLGDDTSNANAGKQKIFKKASTDPTSAWSALANSTSGFTVDYSCFVERQSFFYTGNQSRYIGKFDRNGVAGSNATFLDLTSYTNLSNGFVHPKDGVLYIPYDNKIASIGGSATAAALTLPDSTYKALQPTYYGNYLAIPLVPVTGGSVSKNSLVVLWDRDTSVSTVTEVIDWGNGYLQALNNVDGVLVGVSTGGSNSVTARERDSLQVKVWNGGAPQTVIEAKNGIAAIDPKVNFVNNGRMYISALLGPSASSVLNANGIWSISKNKSGRWALALERSMTADFSDYLFRPYCAVVSNGYTLAGYGASFGNLYVTSTSGFTFTSVYESLINHGMSNVDRIKEKQLKAVGIFTEPLTSGASVTMQYRINGGSWVTALTYSTTGGTGIELPLMGTTAAATGRDIEFRLQSTGGAQITGFAYEYETLKKTL